MKKGRDCDGEARQNQPSCPLTLEAVEAELADESKLVATVWSGPWEEAMMVVEPVRRRAGYGPFVL